MIISHGIPNEDPEPSDCLDGDEEEDQPKITEPAMPWMRLAVATRDGTRENTLSRPPKRFSPTAHRRWRETGEAYELKRHHLELFFERAVPVARRRARRRGD